MKKLIALVVIALGMGMTSQAQDKMMKEKMMDQTVKTIALEQVTGEFVQKQITVDAGTYVFDIKNNNVGHNVGFVLVKKGQDISNPKNHIKTAYVTEQVANNGTQHSNATKLEKGEYVYFCPLNPTSTDNLLIVK
ncbi:plastocyanin/azurin family copper-binding protein [Nonlabens sp. Asnod3-A02]|uniref:plastocyanin/azurin family copper-binding protein n=1 Tax=Nonlabens sp. Asnod3-A02 TaxID=3160579 RepID=UPI00386979CC